MPRQQRASRATRCSRRRAQPEQSDETLEGSGSQVEEEEGGIDCLLEEFDIQGEGCVLAKFQGSGKGRGKDRCDKLLCNLRTWRTPLRLDMDPTVARQLLNFS